MAPRIPKLRRRQAGAHAALDILWFLVWAILNVVFYALVIFLVYRACIFAYDFCYDVFGNNTVEEAPGTFIEIEIPEGTSSMELASKLEMNRLVDNRYAFYLKVKLLGHKVLAGKYRLNTSMTFDEIIGTITDYSNAIVEEADTK